MTTMSATRIKVGFSSLLSPRVATANCIRRERRRDRWQDTKWSQPNTQFEEICLKTRIAVPVILASMALAGLSLIQTTRSQPTPHHIEITAKRFNFTPGEITLKKGEPVVLVLTSTDVPHGIRIRELGIEVKAGKGQTSQVAFTPDKVGTFVGHCSVFCGSGHGSMAFTLHVTE